MHRSSLLLQKNCSLSYCSLSFGVVLLNHAQHAILESLSTQRVWHGACTGVLLCSDMSFPNLSQINVLPISHAYPALIQYTSSKKLCLITQEMAVNRTFAHMT